MEEHPLNEKVQSVMLALVSGETRNPICPYCNSSGLEFSFTYIPPEKYGLFISCSICRKKAHLRLLSRPPGFDEQYVLDEYQQMEEQIVDLSRKLLKDMDSNGN